MSDISDGIAWAMGITFIIIAVVACGIGFGIGYIFGG